MSRLFLLCAVLVAAAAAWLSQGTLAHTSPGGARIAVLPLSFAALSLVGLVAAAVMAARSRGASLVPFVLLVLVILPWLPGASASIFSMWSGALAWLVWLAMALAVIASLPIRMTVRLTRPRLAAGLFASAVFVVAAWQVAPSVPGGDEPHYLVITQSLLQDGDLQIENNHKQGDYRPYFAGTLAPDFRVRGRNGQIYSIHAPGVSALVAPAFAIGGYPAVVAFLIALAAAGTALAWHLAWLVTRREDAAWFGWAVVTLSTTFVFHSFTVYPDGPGAVVVLTGIWALLRAEEEARSGSTRLMPWLLHGAALATLPWMHSRFALLSGGIGALVLLRLPLTKNPAGKAVAFLAVPAVSALLWVSYFMAIYGTPDPSAPYGDEPGSFAFIPGGLTGLFFDQRFGLLAYAPALVFAFGGLVVMLRSRAHRRLAGEWLFVIVPYLLVVTHFAMWWGGRSAPARFVVPVLLLLAVPAAVSWTAIRSRATRATAWATLAFTAFASAVLAFADGGRLAFNTREDYAQWLEWLNPAIELGRGLPAFWRGRVRALQGSGIGWGGEELALYRDVAIWIAALVGGWLVLRALERSRILQARAALGAATAGIYAVAAMAAASVVWSLSGSVTAGATASQLELLRRLATQSRLVAFDPASFRKIGSGAVPAMLRIEPDRATGEGGAGRFDRPLFVLPLIPAGQYRVRPSGTGDGGWLMLGIGRDQFALRTEQLANPIQPVVLTFPVDVRAIVVRGDEQARRTVHRLVVEPISLVPRNARLTSEVARHAVRYGQSTMSFLDEESFAEPETFWVRGGRETRVVLQPDAIRALAPVLVRNGPVENRLLIQAGDWRDEVRLAPGEEHRVDVPLDTRRGATLMRISSSAGFRPSEVDPKSRDDRFLGVLVRVLPF